MRTALTCVLFTLGVFGLWEFSAAAIGQPVFSGFSGWDPCGVVENSATGLLSLLSVVAAVGLWSHRSHARISAGVENRSMTDLETAHRHLRGWTSAVDKR